MQKKFVIIAACILYGITTYFSYELFVPVVTGTGSGSSFVPVADKVIEAETDSGDFAGERNQECPINGEMLTDKHRSNWEKRRPMGVMIENSLDSRPQSGLTSADVVYEYVAEGGITRFLAMFYCKDAKFLGPVRSARVYFIRMLQGYGAHPLYAHVGGAATPGPADALGMISKLKWTRYNDMDQFWVGFPVYKRDEARLKGVATEHTVYTSSTDLWAFAAKKNSLTDVDENGDAWNESFKPWTFADGKPEATPSVTNIAYDFWDGRKDYSVRWEYDAETNTYLRSHGNGVAHTDLNNKKNIAPHNVVVMFVKESEVDDGYDAGTHMMYVNVGKGDAQVYQNGMEIKATWRKPKETDQVRFYDAAGDEISMVRGQTWVSGVPIGNEITTE